MLGGQQAEGGRMLGFVASGEGRLGLKVIVGAGLVRNSALSCLCVPPAASSPAVLWCVSGFCCPHAVISY